MYVIRSKVTNAVLAGLEEITILEDFLHLSKDEAALIVRVLEQGWLTKEEICNALHRGICNCGTRSYTQHLAGILPDHTISPQALGYACLHGTITASDALKIRFDHGETLEEYKEGAETLLDRLYAQIATCAAEEEKVFLSSSNNSCFCCN